MARSAVEVDYKTIGYSGKERNATGLYYYGYRYYQPWVGRWLNADPARTMDGLNLFRMVRNNPVILHDPDGKTPEEWKTQERFKQLPFSTRHLGTRDLLALERGTWKENTFNLLPFSPQGQNDFYNNDNIYNLHLIEDKEVTVYRVEVVARDNRFMHTRIEPDGSVEIYIHNFNLCRN